MIRSVAREFVHGGHLLALGTASIAAFCATLIDKLPTFQLLLMAYLFSYAAYSMNRAVELKQDAFSNPERTSYLRPRKKYLPAITIACFSTGYVLAILTSIPFFLALLIPLVLSLAYTIGSKAFVRLIGAKRLKEKLLLKNIVISLGWSLVPVIVGLYFNEIVPVLLLLMPLIFLRLFVNTIFFDARDIVGDGLYGVRTLPVIYGLHRSYILMNVVDLVSASYILVLIFFGLLPIYSAVIIILPIYSMLYRWLSLKNPAHIDFLCDVVGDGEYILWGAILFIGRILI